MSMQANDETMPDATPAACCGACDHWGRVASRPSDRFALGQCFVRRGEWPVYTSATKACDVQARGQFLFKPLVVLA